MAASSLCGLRFFVRASIEAELRIKSKKTKECLIMNYPDKEIVEKLRRTYPVGCRIVLDKMDAPDIPGGSQATVTGIDDAGSVMCVRDCGGSLSIACGDNCAHKITSEAETTLDWYGLHQPDANARCPRCGEMMWGPTARYALSR